MEFQGLGTVQVWHNGCPLPLGGSRQRALLALLMLEPGRVVSGDRLLERLWPDGRATRATLQRLASRLRHALRADGEVLTTDSGGYRLSVDPDSIDIHRFERLVRRGRVALQSGDAATAADLLAEGLALWRGPALGGVPQHVRDGPAARLDELRVLVLEDRIAADLVLDRHQQLVPELQELVIAHPLRERLAAHLMAALHGCGRGAEALEVYRQARGRMVEDLGIEPGPVLRDAQHRVLTDTSTGADAAPEDDPGTPGPAPPVPAQLPAAIPDFTGRAHQLRRLCDLLGERGDPAAVRVVAVGGPGGVGKTTLAVQAAHLVREAFPDGQLYVDLYGTSAGAMSAYDALGGFLRALGTPPAMVPKSEQERAALYRSRSADRRLLIVLDNARDANQIRPLIPGSGPSAVLVTSRFRLSELAGAQLLDLRELTPAESAELLGRIAGSSRFAAESEASARLVRACEGLPLAVRIVGARLAARPGWSVGALARRLEDERTRLNELRLGTLGVRASFELGYQNLEPEQAHILRLLGTLDCPTFSSRGAAALLECPADEAERVLDGLVDNYLLETTRAGRFRMHDLLRLYVREDARRELGDDTRSAVLTRALRCCLASLRNASRAVIPGSTLNTDETGPHRGAVFADQQQALDWLESERANLVALTHQGARDARVPAILPGRIVEAMKCYLTLGYVKDCVETAESALAAALRDGDPRAEACARLVLGSMADHRAIDADDAADHLQRSLELAHDAGDLPVQSRGANVLALLRARQGRRAEAVDLWNWQLARCREAGDRGGQFVALCNLSDAVAADGDAARGLAYAEEAWDLARALNDLSFQTAGSYTLGLLCTQEQRYGEAREALDRSLKLARELGDPYMEGFALLALGELALAEGDLATAAEFGEAGRRHGEQVTAPSMSARSLLLLGRVHHRRGATDRARRLWRETVTRFDDTCGPETDQARELLRSTEAARRTG